MCWSGQASGVMASIGFGGSIYAKLKDEHWFRWGCLAYFSTMELLQAFTYSVIGICAITGTPQGWWNEKLTILSYLHICFQPIPTNLFGLSFSKTGDDLKKWLWIAMPISLFASFLMVSRMYFHGYLGHCDIRTTPLCGMDTCSYHGEWHIAWRLALNSFDEWDIMGFRMTWFVYNIPVFIMPLFYGGWRWSLYHFVFGILTARLLTGNKDEFPAIWCLSSIAFLIATHIPLVHHWLETPIRKLKPLNPKVPIFNFHGAEK
jgi:hypothetical protein